MAEYIDREEYCEKHCRCSNEHCECHDLPCCHRASCPIWKVPVADVAPVIFARWKYYHKQNIAVCTHCSFERDLDVDFGRAVACPNCGARMDGGDKR